MELRPHIVLVGGSSYGESSGQVLHDLDHIVVVVSEMVLGHVGGDGVGNRNIPPHDEIVAGRLGQRFEGL